MAGSAGVAGYWAAMNDKAAGGSANALRRVLRGLAHPAVLDELAGTMSGADLTTLLLEVSRRRAARITGPEVLRRYGTDRFVAPAGAGFTALRRTEDVLLAALPAGFETLVLAPVLPLGAHSAVAAVDQRNVVATVRGTEVAADPTNGLALEAAARRQGGPGRGGAPRPGARPGHLVRLAATQRVTRAQQFSGPVSFAHFQLFGLVTAGRDPGNHDFERVQLAEHLQFGVTALAAAGADRTTIELTCLDRPSVQVADAARRALAGRPGTEVADAPGRMMRGYYTGLCFKIFATFGGTRIEVADGGFTDWTQRLLGNRKERLLISGYGLDRIAIQGQPPTPQPGAAGS